jgi:hypothetical protein
MKLVTPKDKQLHDYNGPGMWSLESVRHRYLEYAHRLNQAVIRDLTPLQIIQGNNQWIYPVMENIIVGIREGDQACIEIGVEFIESDHRQAFGRILHSNTARELRRSALSAEHMERLRNRILRMLETGNVPHEFHEYAKLIRTIGLGVQWHVIRKRIDEKNSYVMRYVRYFDRYAEKSDH